VDSFESLTPFVPFRRDTDGKVTEEIAKAVYEMKDRLAKVKAELEGRLERLERYIPACEERLERARQRHQKHRERYQAEVEATERTLEKEICQRDARSEPALDIHRWAEAERERIEEELKPVYAQVEATGKKVEKEEEKRERYRQEREEKEQELAEVLQAMEDHPMYELDDRKDQLMSALRIFLVNILQWLRGEVFPEAYDSATYKTLAPFL